MGLAVADAWEQAHPGERLHKGTPYYFLGMGLLISGDLDYGFLYMHQALREDQLSSGQDLPQQPALFFVTMNTRRAEQAFKPQVQAYGDFVRRHMAAYRRSRRGGLKFPRFRSIVSSRPGLLEPLFHLVYATARLIRFGEMSVPSRSTAFGRSLSGQGLFDLCQVAEEWLGFGWRRNPVDMFGALALTYAQATGLKLTQDERNDVNRAANLRWGQTAVELI